MNRAPPQISRRAALVAIPALGAFALGYALGSRVSPRRRWRITPLQDLDSPEPSLRFIALGDTGQRCEQRTSVVAQARRAVDRYGPSFALLLGDLAYPQGLSSATDEAWKTHFEEPFCQGIPDIPYYLAVGNHDSNPQALVDYARTSERLHIPARFYDFTRALPDGRLDASFHVIDSHQIRTAFLGQSEQADWLRQSLGASSAQWRILVSHHAMLSGGTNHGSSKVRRALESTLERGGIDLVLSGHDHDLELLDPGRSWLQVVSGAGSAPRPVEAISGTRFASAEPGFAVLALRSHSIGVEFWTAAKGPVAAFELAPSFAV